MEEMSLKEFREPNHTNTDKSFIIICQKCDSQDVIINTDFDYSQGSEYTGVYGEEVTVLFKCKSCGNAWGIHKKYYV